MTLCRVIGSALVLILTVGAASVSAAPLEAYGRLPNLEEASLSPDGSKLAFVQTAGDTRTVVVTSFPERKVLGALKVSDRKLRELQWADDDNLMIVTSFTAMPWFIEGGPQEWWTLQVYRVSEHKAITVPDPNALRGHDLSGMRTMNVIDGPVVVRKIDGHTVLFATGLCAPSDEMVRGLFRADLATGSQTLLRQGSPATRSWLVDASGNIAAEMQYDSRHQHWTLLGNQQQGKLVEIASADAKIDLPSMYGFGPDGGSVLMMIPRDGKRDWSLISMKDGTASPVEGGGFDVPIDDPLTGRMIGTAIKDDDVQYTFLDRTWQARWAGITRAFKDAHLRLESWTPDFGHLVVRVDGPNFGYLYETVDMGTHKADPLGDVYTGATSPPHAQRITYPAADGLQIPAYLTLPKSGGTHLPLVVMPHGGPAASDSAEFDWWSAALADQGYAVLRPNYRGSDLGWEFMSRGFGEFGRKMQSDLSDGVRYLAQAGTIDPSRVCIVGASYGGYAALAGATLQPDVYRCAVAVAGISDLHRFLHAETDGSRGGDERLGRYWDRYLGVDGPDDAHLDAISPIQHVSAEKIPILLIHGKDDTVVPFEQSRVMLDALQRAHKDAKLVVLKHEDHWLSGSETRLQMLQETAAFLHEHNPADHP